MLSFVSFVQEVSPVAKLSASCESHHDVHDHEDDDDDDDDKIWVWMRFFITFSVIPNMFQRKSIPHFFTCTQIMDNLQQASKLCSSETLPTDPLIGDKV